MFTTQFTEVRVVKGVYIKEAATVGYVGLGFVKGTGKGNFAATPVDGMLAGGEVKVTLLHNGRYSIRSIGRKGNGRLVHISGTATLIVDGVSSTVAEFFARSTGS